MATIEGLSGGMLLSLVVCCFCMAVSHSLQYCKAVQSVWSRFMADKEAKERALVFVVSLLAGSFALHFMMGE